MSSMDSSPMQILRLKNPHVILRGQVSIRKINSASAETAQQGTASCHSSSMKYRRQLKSVRFPEIRIVSEEILMMIIFSACIQRKR